MGEIMVDFALLSTSSVFSIETSKDASESTSQLPENDGVESKRFNCPDSRENQQRHRTDAPKYVSCTEISTDGEGNLATDEGNTQHQQQSKHQHSTTNTDQTNSASLPESSILSNPNLLAATPEDARDEEEVDTICSSRWYGDDPYIYSDDSASLSDTYFFPQPDDDLARPASYRNEEADSMTKAVTTVNKYPLANYYGSIGTLSSEPTTHSHTNFEQISLRFQPNLSMQRSTSPLWVTAGSIQEDSEELIPITANSGIQSSATVSSQPGTLLLLNGTPRKDKRQLRKNKKIWFLKLQQRKREIQANRESRVNQIRGRPQTGKARDAMWAYLFLAQFFAVCFSAIYFGRHLILQSNMEWSLFIPNPISGRNFHYWNDDGENKPINVYKHEVPIEVIPVLPVLEQNTSTHELQYNENLLKNESLTTSSLTKASPLTTIDIVLHLNAEASGADETSSSSVANNSSFVIDFQNVLTLLNVSGFYACALSFATFSLMIILSRCVIHIMLIFTILLALGWGVTGLSLDPYGVISIMGFTALLLALGYAMYHWQRVPFAATNLNMALKAVRCTADVALLGLGGLLASFAWLMIWSVAVIGFVNKFQNTACDANGLCHPHIVMAHIPLYFLLILSYHWTNTVLKNVLRVTVATVIGTWWFYPTDIGYFCTAAVAKPLFRSLTKHLGSISLGSLVVQPAQLLLIICGSCYHRPSLGNVCIHESACNVDDKNEEEDFFQVAEAGLVVTSNLIDKNDNTECDESLCGLYTGMFADLESYNNWCFTYIGMYGYGCSEGGSLALKLFETREWLEVVKDGLINDILLMACVMIGGTTGTFAVAVEETGGYFFSTSHKPLVTAFVIGSVVGYVLSNTLLLGVVGSAANTILVCFAAGPFEFDKNHPNLSREMRDVWIRQVWEAPS